MSEPARQPVGTVELFFDLVFVFALTQVSAMVSAHEGAAGLMRAGVVFLIIYWLWVVTAIQASFHNVSSPRVRATLFTTTFLALVAALCIPEMFEDTSRAIVFAAAYWASRAVVLVGLLRGRWRTFGLYLVTLVFSGPLLVVGAFLPSPWREVSWGVVGVVEVLIPLLQRSRMASLRYDAPHVVERFGLLVLIALGESIVAIGEPLAASAHWGWPQVLALVGSFTLVAGLWWLYFDHSDRLIVLRIQAAPVQFDAVRSLLAYGHLWIVGGIIAAAAALHSVITHPDEHLELQSAVLLSGGVATFLLVFVQARLRAYREVYWSRLVSAVLLLAAVPLTLSLPAFGGLIVITGIVAVAAVWEAAHPRSAGVPSQESVSALGESTNPT